MEEHYVTMTHPYTVAYFSNDRPEGWRGVCGSAWSGRETPGCKCVRMSSENSIHPLNEA